MKIILNTTAFFIVFISLFVRCSDDFLEYEKHGSPSSASFWKTSSDAEMAANGLYTNFTNSGIVGRGFMWYLCASDNMIVGRDKTQSVNMKNFIDNGANSYTAQNWPAMYRLIGRANEIIEFVPQMEIDQSVKNSVLGQAYFFRGWAYMWLAPRYGDNRAGIPIVEPGLTMEEFDVPRAKHVSENYNYCVSDFDRAAELLPYFDEMKEDDFGRPHKTACWAYAAKAMLYNAEYDADSYAKVEMYANKVIDSKRHRLLSNYDDVFKMENNWSSEYIWSFVSTNNKGSITPSVFLENKGWGKYNGWGYWHATEELYDAFEQGDPRREATILKFGDEFEYFGETMRYYSTNNRTGFQFRKFMDPFVDQDCVGKDVNPNGDNPTTNLNMPLIRYAEILLFKSEALIMQGKNGDEPLNKVRNRVGLSPIKGATMEELKQERRVELAAEWADRHYDLVRWHDAEAIYAKPLHGRIHKNMSDPDSPYTIEEVWASRSYDPIKNHVWPIPPQEIESSKVLIQNEGY